MERVMGISALIRTPRYRFVFDEVREVPKGKAGFGKQTKWTQHEIFLQRPGFALDPSVQAAGVLSAGTGGRADLLILDDVVDQKNALDEPKLRDKVADNIDNVWMSRLEPGGRVIMIATPWHQNDYTHRIQKREVWCTLRQWVSDDFSRIEQEVYNPPVDYPIPRARPKLRLVG
jgi:hypothetical protein